jgi:hypothetical protein
MPGIVFGLFLVVAGTGRGLGTQVSTPDRPSLVRSIRVFDYRNRSFPVSIDLRGTALLPNAQGMVAFVGKLGDLDLTAAFTGLLPASRFGAEYLTYVVWAITPEGRPVNIAEILVEGAGARFVAPSGKRKVTTDLKVFGLAVSVEPYFAVTTPSDVVVMENDVKPKVTGEIEDSEVKYYLLPKGYYVPNVSPQDTTPAAAERTATFEILEARHALQIARWAGADRYAPESFGVATLLLHAAEAEEASKKPDSRLVMKTAREAVETAEDARAFSLKRKNP